MTDLTVAITDGVALSRIVAEDAKCAVAQVRRASYPTAGYPPRQVARVETNLIQEAGSA